MARKVMLRSRHTSQISREALSRHSKGRPLWNDGFSMAVTADRLRASGLGVGDSSPFPFAHARPSGSLQQVATSTTEKALCRSSHEYINSPRFRVEDPLRTSSPAQLQSEYQVCTPK